MDSPRSPPHERRGIQSVEVGGQLLLALAHAGRPMALKDLALAAGMAPAKAHPYLVSFGKLGLVAQEAGRYGLGPLALQLGLISLQQFDPVRLATPRIAELAPLIGHTVALAVWGNRGPTIVRIEQAPSPVHVAMRHGTVMSLRDTASGCLFAAYLPRDIVLAGLAAEDASTTRTGGRAARPRPLLDGAFRRRLDEVRLHRLSHAVDTAVPGVSALAAPVFDGAGTIVLCITAIGPTAVFDARFDGAVARALRCCAEELSRQLGAG
jgi:DNA-binding IclR family transcriptional regulator